MKQELQRTFEGYKNKLVNDLYALLCEKEKKGEWEAFLDTINVELIGHEEKLNSINYWKLRANLGALRYLSYVYFRKTIFDCITLVKGIDNESYR